MSNDTELVCSICLCDIDDITKNIIKTECCHIFHSNCFLKNVAFNGFSCPNCRTILYDEDNEDNYSDEDDEEERFILNGSRWLFMRAEGIEIHHHDNDDYDYDDDEEDTDYDEEDTDYDEEDEDYEDYDEEEYEEEERIKLNGFRWLFMRAEGIEIHRFDTDDYEFDENDYNYEDNYEDNNQNNQTNNQNNNNFVREPALSGVNISINDIAEKIIQKGVTYKELLVLVIGFNIHNASDVAEYGKRQLNEIEQMIYDISDGISN